MDKERVAAESVHIWYPTNVNTAEESTDNSIYDEDLQLIHSSAYLDPLTKALLAGPMAICGGTVSVSTLKETEAEARSPSSHGRNPGQQLESNF